MSSHAILKGWLKAKTLTPIYKDTNSKAIPQWSCGLDSFTPLPFFFSTPELQLATHDIEEGKATYIYTEWGVGLHYIGAVAEQLGLEYFSVPFDSIMTGICDTAISKVLTREPSSRKCLIHCTEVQMKVTELAFKEAFRVLDQLRTTCVVVISGLDPLLLTSTGLPYCVFRPFMSYDLEPPQIAEALHTLIGKNSTIFMGDADHVVKVATQLRGKPLPLSMFLERVASLSLEGKPVSLQRCVYDVWKSMVSLYDRNAVGCSALGQFYELRKRSSWEMTQDNNFFFPKNSSGYHVLMEIGHELNVNQLTSVIPTDEGILVKRPYPWTRFFSVDDIEEALQVPILRFTNDTTQVSGHLYQVKIALEAVHPERQLLEVLCLNTPYQPDPNTKYGIRSVAKDEVDIDKLGAEKSVLMARDKVNPSPFTDIIAPLILRPEYRGTGLPIHGVARLQATENSNTTEVHLKTSEHFGNCKKLRNSGVNGMISDANFMTHGAADLDVYLNEKAPQEEGYSASYVILCGYKLWQTCPSAALVSLPPPMDQVALSDEYMKEVFSIGAKRRRTEPVVSPNTAAKSADLPVDTAKANWRNLLKTVETSERVDMQVLEARVIDAQRSALEDLDTFSLETARAVFKMTLQPLMNVEIHRIRELAPKPISTALEYILMHMPLKTAVWLQLTLIVHPPLVEEGLKQIAKDYDIVIPPKFL
ncbi:hypothetical protein Pelo_8442 [Pelomyxa schiedti]|nr:hypothetical protein Pelo_8442 [Pelomyxa schiedti]